MIKNPLPYILATGFFTPKPSWLLKALKPRIQAVYLNIILVMITLANTPTKVANNAPARVYLVFLTLAAIKYTLMV
jgi:hypothetical protein